MVFRLNEYAERKLKIKINILLEIYAEDKG